MEFMPFVQHEKARISPNSTVGSLWYPSFLVHGVGHAGRLPNPGLPCTEDPSRVHPQDITSPPEDASIASQKKKAMKTKCCKVKDRDRALILG